MNRIQLVDPSTATGKAQRVLDGIKAKLGVVPNLTRVLANSPAALEGYASFTGAMAGGALGAKLREKISLAVAEANSCGYCLSAHTFIGGKVGLTEKEIADAREAGSDSPKEDAVLKLAKAIVEARGLIDDQALASARTAGLTDADIVETTANVALNIFTNYINHVAQTAVDFPEVKPAEACACCAR